MKPKLGILVNTIVRYEHRHGIVTYNQGHLKVDFPETHDNSCHYEQRFQLNGTLMPECKDVVIKVVLQPNAKRTIELTSWVCVDGTTISVSKPSTVKPKNAFKLYSTEFLTLEIKKEDLWQTCRDLNKEILYG